MKKKLLTALLAMYILPAYAQVELKGVMGIHFFSSPSMQDYINQSYAGPNDQLGSFVSSIIFAGEGGSFLNPEFIVTLEVAYQIYSFTNSGINGQYDLSFNNILPSLLAYYVIGGDGYNFKFGGGTGIRLIRVDETKPASGIKTFTSIGFGVIGRIEGNTSIGENVYANVGLDFRYDVNGEPDSNGETLRNTGLRENVNFNSLSVGLRLGITYVFGEVN